MLVILYATFVAIFVLTCAAFGVAIVSEADTMSKQQAPRRKRS